MISIHKIEKALVCFFCLFTYSSFSQTIFQKSYSNQAYDKGTCVEKTSDGGYIVGGTSGTGTFGPDKMYLIKTDFAGSVLWSKTYYGTISEYLATVKQTSDGGYILVGTTFSFNAQPYGDIWVVKINASGTITWQNHFGYTGYDYGYSVQQTPDGGYVIGGLTSTFGAGAYDYYIMKIDSLGNALWGTAIGGVGNDEGYAILQTPDGGYMIAGQENSYAFTMFSPYNMMLCKLNAAGTLVWSKSYGGGNSGGNYICNALRRTTDGGFIMGGWTDGVGAGQQDVCIVKVDSAGILQWSKTFGGTGSDFGNDIRQTANGGYAIAGTTNSFGAGNDDAYLITTDANGNLVWSVCYGDTAIDRGNSLDQTADGGFIMAGQTSATGSGNSDVYLIKCDNTGFTGCHENDVLTVAMNQSLVETSVTPQTESNALWILSNASVGTGCVETTLCSSVGINETQEKENISIFPNPASNEFTINTDEKIISVEIFDVFGQLIFSANELDSNEMIINSSEWSAGIYFIKTKTKEGEVSTKLLKNN